MTYRRNFPPLLGRLYQLYLITFQDSTYISDTGWGCMVRAGQMVMAQIMKKHLKNNNDQRDKFLGNIAQAFADDDDGENKNLESLMEKIKNESLEKKTFICPFSIQKIARLAKKEFNLNPGEWYKPNYILYILESLHNNFPIRGIVGSENLRMLVFNDSSLFLDQVVFKMFELPLKCPKHKDNKILQSQKGQNKKSSYELQQIYNLCDCMIEKKEFNAVAIFVLTRIGLDEPNPEYLRVLDQLMEIESFQGVVGGSPQKALFILGRIGDQYIYLDPHYVQESQTRQQILVNNESFSCQYLHLLNQKGMDTSMGIAFYVRDYAGLIKFWSDIKKIKENNKENFFIFATEETPDFQTLGQTQSLRSNDDEIIIIN